MEVRHDERNSQWALINPLSPEPPRRTDGRGRPWWDAREGLTGILWILRRSARWHDLPNRFPPYPTCHRRLQQWARDGTLRIGLEMLAADLRERGELDLREGCIDGTLVVAKKGPRRGNNHAGAGDEAPGGGRRRWLPLTVRTAAATPHEVPFITDTLAPTFIPTPPER